MFIHETHLPQLLTPEQYTSPEQLEREMAQLFRPGWHFIGTLAEIPRDGDFLTCELLGHPLIVWRTAGKVQAFLNVCPHRFSRISGQACGHAEERLVCQYHGWEFDATGNTRQIPDARSFRPMTQGELGLTTFRTETCGQLIFVSLEEHPPELEEFLGPGYEVTQELFSAGRRMVLKLDYEVDANWKVKVENSLESYHVELVHPATFRETPDASLCRHELEPRWTMYATTQQAVEPLDRFLDRLTLRIADYKDDGEYRHYHYYPHLLFGRMRLFTFAETVYPVSPGRTRIVARVFCYPGTPGRLRTRLLFRGLKWWGRKFWSTVHQEDCSVMPDVQKGLEAPRHPSRGLISIREERLFHFQEYVRDATLPASATRTNGQMAPRAELLKR